MLQWQIFTSTRGLGGDYVALWHLHKDSYWCSLGAWPNQMHFCVNQQYFTIFQRHYLRFKPALLTPLYAIYP